MDINDKTEAHIDKTDMKEEILQYTSPNGQFMYNMYIKLNITFKVDTIASATERFTEKNKK